MAKLIMTLDGAVIREYHIDKDSISVGRKHGNDIQLNDLTVSGRHSLITVMGDNTYVDDLGSTNGTLLNGARVAKSVLKHGDLIQVGNYQFTYFSDDQEEYEPTMFLRAEIEDTQIIQTNPPKTGDAKGEPLAAVKILNGPLKDKVLELRKPFNTLGFNGIKMAMIARTMDGYTIATIHSTKLRRANDAPSINGKLLVGDSQYLHSNDIIELAGTQMQFFYID
ncbi:MAG: FHA domain-containing protein [Gammaproteobacteria bacterium]|nr:FHA domain-containing protein [Gammaproteobacteria bacterium]